MEQQYRELCVHVAQYIDKETLQKMIELCGAPPNASSLSFVTWLKGQGLISNDDLAVLVYLLRVTKQTDLVDEVENYATNMVKYGAHVDVDPLKGQRTLDDRNNKRFKRIKPTTTITPAPTNDGLESKYAKMKADVATWLDKGQLAMLCCISQAPPSAQASSLKFIEWLDSSGKISANDVGKLVQYLRNPAVAAVNVWQTHVRPYEALLASNPVQTRSGRRLLIGLMGDDSAAFANTFSEEFKFTKFGFQDPVKDLVSKLFGLNDTERYLLDVVVPRWNATPTEIYDGFGEMFRWSLPQFLAESNFRTRSLTTRLFEEQFAKWNSKDDVVVPDVRYADEIDLIHALGGVVWRIGNDRRSKDLPVDLEYSDDGPVFEALRINIQHLRDQ